MNKMNQSMTLKSQFIICCLVVAFVPTFVLSIYLYNSRVNEIRHNYIENRVKAITQVNRNVKDKVEWINSLVDQLNNNSNLKEIARREDGSAIHSDLQYMNTIKDLQNNYTYTPIFKDMRAMILKGENGMDIRQGADAALLSMERIQDMDWFKRGEERNLLTWGGLTMNYSDFAPNSVVNAIRWPLKDYITDNVIGYGIMLLNKNVLSSCFEDLATYVNDKIYILSSDGDLISTNQISGGSLVETSSTIQEVIDEVMEINDRAVLDRVYNYITEVEGISSLVTYGVSMATGWITIEILPVHEIDIQGRNFIVTVFILGIGTMLVCIALSVYISAKLTKPLNWLVSYVKDIGQGNFYKLNIKPSKNELSILANNISKMQSDIISLMEDKVKNEQEKRTLEIQMLQSQINPHFLYNTLNNIRLMATLQGAAGIVRITDALGRILRYSLKKSSEKTLVAEEIDIIQDYLHIQNIRYKGKIRFQLKVEDPELKRCLMPRFVLQPIVENSIVHGLCYDDNLGKIFISISEKQGSLSIEVVDNGIGMKVDKLNTIKAYLSSDSEKDRPDDMGLGIYNVHRRIHLMYGSKYGINIESRYREYTKVTILLALDLGESENENTSG